MEPDYTKRELDEYFKELGSKIDANTELTKDLNIKVGIQNGRVAKTEATLKGAVMAGSVAVFLVGIIMSLSVYAFNISLKNQKSEILLEIATKE